MSAPIPPQGNQQQHTERPLKIYAEQYLTGQSLPIGAVIDPGDPPIYQDGQPRVLLPGGWVVVHEGEWVISNRYTGKPSDVMSAEEYAERFGPAGAL